MVSGPPDGPVVRRQQLMDRLLALVDRSVGGGEAVPDAEWDALRVASAGHARSLELVGRLHGVVADCNREIEERRAAGADVAPLREAILEYVRSTVAEKSRAPVSGG
jgi:hypothetical protein